MFVNFCASAKKKIFFAVKGRERKHIRVGGVGGRVRGTEGQS